jgi:transposase InsO family protein
VIGLPRATFYYQLQKLGAEDRYGLVKEDIRAVFNKHRGRYGYRRITAALWQLGHQINHKTVQRLNGVLGLKSMVPPKR